MLTSTDEVQSCVNSMRSRVPRNSSVLIGDYLLHDNYVTLVLKKQESKGVNFNYRRQKKREPVHDSGEQTFHIVSNNTIKYIKVVYKALRTVEEIFRTRTDETLWIDRRARNIVQ